MKTIELNHYNASFRVSGSEATRSLAIQSIMVKEWPEAASHLKLLVLDEKDIPIYSQVLDSPQAKEDAAIPVDKSFVFYDHLSVQVISEPAGMPFSVVVNFD
ncbi:hypothetical protein GCM10023188_28480 [Pontibacter saemangeumensis]|uniref:Uncharacterized protein n=1 Tax=Pontibacter saemangeumensis TaxID=1084525 RepID=A0ABP8LSV1_9BACT